MPDMVRPRVNYGTLASTRRGLQIAAVIADSRPLRRVWTVAAPRVKRSKKKEEHLQFPESKLFCSNADLSSKRRTLDTTDCAAQWTGLQTVFRTSEKNTSNYIFPHCVNICPQMEAQHAPTITRIYPRIKDMPTPSHNTDPTASDDPVVIHNATFSSKLNAHT
jgi:hypothetical protein